MTRHYLGRVQRAQEGQGKAKADKPRRHRSKAVDEMTRQEAEQQLGRVVKHAGGSRRMVGSTTEMIEIPPGKNGDLSSLFEVLELACRLEPDD